jgi:hypothetical protein
VSVCFCVLSCVCTPLIPSTHFLCVQKYTIHNNQKNKKKPMLHHVANPSGPAGQPVSASCVRVMAERAKSGEGQESPLPP